MLSPTGAADGAACFFQKSKATLPGTTEGGGTDVCEGEMAAGALISAGIFSLPGWGFFFSAGVFVASFSISFQKRCGEGPFNSSIDILSYLLEDVRDVCTVYVW